MRENVFHFLGVCPILKEIRRAYFGKNVLSEVEMMEFLTGINFIITLLKLKDTDCK